MKALITGGAGFIGHHLIEHILVNTDWEVVCLDRLDVSGDLNRLNEVISYYPEWRLRFKFVYHDLKAPIHSHVAHEIGKPNLIFHLAASSHVDRSIEDPLLFVQDNVVGTCNLLNFARTLDGLDYIQNFSTDEVYGDCIGREGFFEDGRHNPQNPYAATKSGAEYLARSFAHTYGLPIVTTNCMNVIGERQHPEKFVPMCIKKILALEKIYLHCYPNSNRTGSRFYVHARNVADASIFLVDHFKKGETYNLVGQQEVSNFAMMDWIAQYIGIKPIYELCDFHFNRPGHDLRYALNGDKMLDLGYKYPVEFWDSLNSTIQWTLQNTGWLY